MLVKCKCGHVVLNEEKTAKENNYHPLTLLRVYSVMLLGAGYDGVNELVVSFFSLKHFTKATFTQYANYITLTAGNHAKNVLDQSRKARPGV